MMSVGRGSKPMLTVQRRNTSKSRTNCVRENIQIADFPFTKDCFDLGPHFLDGIQIRAIGRKVQQSYTFRFQNLPDGFYMVRAHIIHHNDVARSKSWK